MRVLPLLIIWVMSVADAVAQSVQQSGIVTPGHPPVWTTDGVIGDGGPASEGSLTALGVTVSGIGICQNSDFLINPYNQVCVGADATGGQIYFNNIGGATGGFNFVVNGTSYPFPFTAGGGVVGPGSSIVGNLTCWNNTSGTLLSDCSIASSNVPTKSGTNSFTGANTFTLQITSSLATGTAPFSIASTTNVANLNASSLNGATFAAPGAIGGTTPAAGTFTALTDGVQGSITGILALVGTTSGIVSIKPADAAGTYNFTLPITAGTVGQPLLSGGGGGAAQTYGTLGVAGGGTGAATLSAHSVLVGEGTSAITPITVGTTGQLLQGATAADPAWATTLSGNYTFSGSPIAANGALWQFGAGAGTPTHIASGQTTAPAVTSCGSGSPTAAGSDTAAIVTNGGGSITSCVVTFNVAYTGTPACVTSANNQTITVRGTPAPTTLTATFPAATSLVWNYICIAPSGG